MQHLLKNGLIVCLFIGFIFPVVGKTNRSDTCCQKQKVPSGPIPAGEYLGQKPPHKIPLVFAPGIVCRQDRFVQDIAFSPDKKEICFVVTNPEWNRFVIYNTKQKVGIWTLPVPATHLGNSGSGLRPYFSANGKYFYFISTWPRNILVSKKIKGQWSTPVKLDGPINSEKIENSFSHADDNLLFFCSHREGGEGGCDSYCIKKPTMDQPENLKVINTKYNDCGPVMAPDGSYLLFHSNRPGGFGGADLYVCFKKKNKWTNPKNLGPAINTEALEIIAHISPDGKYIFFTRRKGIRTQTPSKIFWVRASIIEDIK